MPDATHSPVIVKVEHRCQLDEDARLVCGYCLRIIRYADDYFVGDGDTWCLDCDQSAWHDNEVA